MDVEDERGHQLKSGLLHARRELRETSVLNIIEQEKLLLHSWAPVCRDHAR